MQVERRCYQRGAADNPSNALDKLAFCVIAADCRHCAVEVKPHPVDRRFLVVRCERFRNILNQRLEGVRVDRACLNSFGEQVGVTQQKVSE
jgi:hypothetical protein